ncbi:MAG: helix-hairpin-helix domain-containing protein, partial [Planctomycetota bacterium]
LADLEVAAHDGRLARVPGMGPRRIPAVRESLAGRFRRGPAVPESRRRQPDDGEIPVDELLDIDREYRRKADRDRLPRIAPRRFNPTGAAWLPVLHTHRGPRHFTALFSNTARAHELGMTHDWVVIYRDDHEGEGQWTVVTARLGPLRGRRVVRGRETECRAHYERSGTPPPENELF